MEVPIYGKRWDELSYAWYFSSSLLPFYLLLCLWNGSWSLCNVIEQERHDLADLAHVGTDINLFRAEFDFWSSLSRRVAFNHFECNWIVILIYHRRGPKLQADYDLGMLFFKTGEYHVLAGVRWFRYSFTLTKRSLRIAPEQTPRYDERGTSEILF